MTAVLWLPVMVALSALGCAVRNQCVDQCNHCCPAPNHHCYGYYSTCWRPWPAECPNRPSYAIMPPMQEQVLSDVPLEPLPAPRNTPTPAATPEQKLPPIVEPAKE